MNNGGIYIHIPFCSHKCLYCDFYTGGARIAHWDTFIECIITELNSRCNEINFHPSTLYFGGGTPSLIPPVYFHKIITEISKISGINKWQEFTIEVNPEDVSLEKIDAWKSAGVNRISVGVQSLNDLELKAIGRNHDSNLATNALNLLKSRFDNISVDVMFGLPGQTLKSYKVSLKRILEFAPTHVSPYSLMLEERTALSLLVRKNKISLPDEDEWMEMFNLTSFFLQDNGFKRYEISNYAKPGWESGHNTSYWLGKPYLGLGPGAHSYDGSRIRRFNPNDIKGYLQHFFKPVTDYEKHFFIKENLSDLELKEEMIMTRLRTVKGLNLSEFAEKFGETSKKILLNKSKKYISSLRMKKEDDFLALSSEGFLIYNSILSDLF